MRYKNTKTGAIIDSPFELAGDNWELVSTENYDVKNAEVGNLSQQGTAHLLRKKDKENAELKATIAELTAKETNETDTQQNDEMNEEEEYVEEEVVLTDMTNSELEKFAKEEGIELTAKNKQNKANLIEAISKAFED